MAWEAVVGVLAIMTIKLTALVIGYLIVRLGHDTLIRGISGEFKFEGQMSDAKAKLTGASPGLFFVLMGTALGTWAVFVDKPVNISRPAYENDTNTNSARQKEPSVVIKPYTQSDVEELLGGRGSKNETIVQDK